MFILTLLLLLLLLILFLLFPLALQPVVGFGLSDNVPPFCPIYHQPAIFSLPALEDLFLLLLSIFSWAFPIVSSLPVLK
jgi:hypothetical protein